MENSVNDINVRVIIEDEYPSAINGGTEYDTYDPYNMNDMKEDIKIYLIHKINDTSNLMIMMNNTIVGWIQEYM